MSALQSHFAEALESVKEVKVLVGTHNVVHVRAIQEEICMESFPCQGHKGVILEFADGTTMQYECSSVSIGAIQKNYFPEEKTHFSMYVTDLVLQ